MFRALQLIGITALTAITAVGVRAAELVMVEEHGCVWCETWNEEIAPIYPKTAEGRFAPLRRIDIHDPLPEDLSFARRLSFTPTFVLIDDGAEVARIEGYPGEDFFWGLLERMLIENTSFEGDGT